MTDRSERDLQVTADELLGKDLSETITHGSDADVTLPDASADTVVKTSLKLPIDLHRRVKAAADARGTGVSTLIREWIEVGLTDLDHDRQVSLADIRRAIAHAAQTGDAA
ncbi:MAG: hypothetical protein ACRDUA_08625 [Micromonosporaceae bacterium]